MSLSPTEVLTQCQCKEPGWCERHKCLKHAHWHHLCQTNQAYFDAWEEGKGPGQILHHPGGKPAPVHVDNAHGWGDSVTSALKKIGVTEERYKAVKEMFGLPPTCGCAKRREWLNAVGRWWNGEDK